LKQQESFSQRTFPGRAGLKGAGGYANPGVRGLRGATRRSAEAVQPPPTPRARETESPGDASTDWSVGRKSKIFVITKDLRSFGRQRVAGA